MRDCLWLGSLLTLKRNTPIGFLHRFLVVHIPASIRRLDILVTNGRITSGGSRLGRRLMYDKHPLVVIFFLGLLTASSALFIPAIWSKISTLHKLLVIILLPLPYIFTYLSATRNSDAYITAHNHAEQMRHYPYDRILFYPGMACSTCKFLKPARSKHCSICKTCVARMDHHCVWVNNCLGRGNYRWFLALLLSTGIVLAYGAYLAYIVIFPGAAKDYARYEHWYRYKGPSSPRDWPTYFDMKLHYFLTYVGIYLEVGGLRAAGVGLLALMTWPLPLGLLAYHIYLIWAGMTTNESSKWSDWRDEMAEGVVFLGRRREETITDERSEPDAKPPSPTPNPTLEEEEPPTTWPLESRHILIRTLNGQAPQSLPSRISSVADLESFERVENLSAVENVYDIGFWDNFLEAMK